MYPFLNSQYNESLRQDLCLVWKMYAQEGLRRGMVVTFRLVPLTLPSVLAWIA
jgi:inner membrane protease subunit 2